MKEISNELLGVINDKFNNLKPKLDESFNNHQIEEIVNNLINGKIDRYLAQKAHEFSVNKLNSLIEKCIEEVLKEENIELIINMEVKKYIYSKEFKEMIERYFLYEEDINQGICDLILAKFREYIK